MYNSPKGFGLSFAADGQNGTIHKGKVFADLYGVIDGRFSQPGIKVEYSYGLVFKEGDKERLQGFEGVVIAKKNGSVRESFTVRRVTYGVGVSSNIIDGKYFLAGYEAESDQTNVFADYYSVGKSTFNSRQFQFDTGVNIDLSPVLKGLSFHTQISIDYATTYTTYYSNKYATFEPAWSSANGVGAIIGTTQYNEDSANRNQNITGMNDNQTIAFNAHFDYKRTFNNDHNVNAVLVANGFTQSLSGQYHNQQQSLHHYLSQVL